MGFWVIECYDKVPAAGIGFATVALEPDCTVNVYWRDTSTRAIHIAAFTEHAAQSDRF